MIAKSTDPVRLPVGQKVISIMGEMGRAFDGCYAEYALLPNHQIYPVTTDLPWEIFAALPEIYYTAYGSMKILWGSVLSAGMAVLLNAALKMIEERM